MCSFCGSAAARRSRASQQLTITGVTFSENSRPCRHQHSQHVSTHRTVQLFQTQNQPSTSACLLHRLYLYIFILIVLCAPLQAFEARLKKDLNTTAAALLSNKELLTKVLQVRMPCRCNAYACQVQKLVQNLERRTNEWMVDARF